MRVLMIAPAWIGDAIMAQPLFARLLQKNPDICLEALAPAWVAPALSRMREISHVRLSPFAHGELAWTRRRQLARELKQRAYTRAYVLPNSLKSALIPFFAGIPERVGFTGEARFGLLNIRHPLDKKKLPLIVERYAQLAEEPGAPLPRPVPAPVLRSTPEEQSATLQALSLTRPDSAIALCPGAEYGSAKRWPAEHFAALARALIKDGHALLLLGSGKDRPIADSILATLEKSEQARCQNLCGLTSIPQAIDLLALARLVVCNDSGLMHIAAALNRPTLALFGSSSPEVTPPLSALARAIHLRLPCSPCFRRICPLGHLDCLNKIRPEQISALCRTQLDKT
ncbi:MAG: lipopolysaccharide heptosyltransferase II [Zoogloeaceae bacterium]|jgi:heptosyltransferase-2|nr:lipopolysaccharide heptosyltransferase II [Zoogloeaceae bacterium]